MFERMSFLVELDEEIDITERKSPPGPRCQRHGRSSRGDAPPRNREHGVPMLEHEGAQSRGRFKFGFHTRHSTGVPVFYEEKPTRAITKRATVS